MPGIAGQDIKQSIFYPFMLMSHLLCSTTFNPQKNTCELAVAFPFYRSAYQGKRQREKSSFHHFIPCILPPLCTKSFSHLISRFYCLFPMLPFGGWGRDPPKSLNQIRKATGLPSLLYLIPRLNMRKQSWCLGIQPLLPQAVWLAANLYQLLPDGLALAFDIHVTGSTVQPSFFSSH